MKTELFSTPIYVVDVPEEDRKIIDTEVETVLKNSKFRNEFTDLKNTESTPVFGNILHECEFTKLKTVISTVLYEYYYSIHQTPPDFPVGFQNSWITRTNIDHHVQVHHHQNVGISGVYYHKVDKNSGNLYFRSSDKFMECSRFYKRKQDYEVQPQCGRLVLFPSWLDHGARSSSSEDTRISLSFNIGC